MLAALPRPIGHAGYRCAMARGLLLALAVLALLPAAASARAIRAEAILPPGQSGHVSITGLAEGQGSPHLYDQHQPFIDFKRRSFLFNQPGRTENPRPGVRIVRDAYGVPAITASTDYGVWWGAGYAVAQDRLFQLELFRRATTGRLSEIVGQGYLEDDIVARRDYYTAPELDAMLAALPGDLRARFDAYRDGVNAWVAHVQMNPNDMPGEYAAVGTTPTPWTVRDSVAVGVFLARTVPSGDGAELLNLKLLKQEGVGALTRLVPLRIRNQATTVPKREGIQPQGHRTKRREERVNLRNSVELARELPLPEATASAAARKRGGTLGPMGKVGGSMMFAVRGAGGRAWLFNGPQLGYSVPELFVELELHGPRGDIRGVTAAGVPVIGIGHNDHVAWGFTSGLSDEDDLYAEKLVPGQRERYVFQGRERQMECRDEVFNYRSPPSDLLNLPEGTVPGAGSRTERICRTVHGPVQARAGNVAYARRYAIWKREVETLVGLTMLNEARTITDVDRAMQEVTWNENVMAADSQGNIGYWHPGLFQRRPKGWDQRLPMPGTGEAEWPGLLPRRLTPHVINPRQGWLANWNNVPSEGWETGDAEASERVSGPFHRGAFLMALVRRLARDPSFAAAEQTVKTMGTVAQQRPLAHARLRRALRGARGNAAVLLQTVVDWDGDYHRTAADGTVSPGVAAWQELKRQLRKRALAPLGKVAEERGDEPGSSHAFDAALGDTYALRTETPRGWRLAAADAFAELAKRFKSEDPARWRTPRRMYEVSAQGAGSAPPLPFFDRGTWEQLIELGP